MLLLCAMWAVVSEGWAEVAGSPGVEEVVCPGLQAPEAEEGAVLGPMGPSPRGRHGWLCWGITRGLSGSARVWGGPEGQTAGDPAGEEEMPAAVLDSRFHSPALWPPFFHLRFWP